MRLRYAELIFRHAAVWRADVPIRSASNKKSQSTYVSAPHTFDMFTSIFPYTRLPSMQTTAFMLLFLSVLFFTLLVVVFHNFISACRCLRADHNEEGRQKKKKKKRLNRLSFFHFFVSHVSSLGLICECAHINCVSGHHKNGTERASCSIL